MFDLADLSGHEFFRPMVTGWLSKIEAAVKCKGRTKWKEVADECLMFYSRSAAAMWDSTYSRKFWKGVKAPKFRITVNKAFEFVAIYGPNLIWDTPHRTVNTKKLLDIPPEVLGPMAEQFQMMNAQETAKDKAVAQLMQHWLNYTPREMPGGGLESHNELAVVDALVKGRGCLWPQVYRMPGSERTLTGCFRKPPEDLLIDPDFKTLQEAKWIALRHVEPHWVVEKKFQLPANSLKNKATVESGWHYAELKGTDDQGTGERKSGKTNDLVVWYEIWSKMGTGARLTGMPDFLKNQLEESVGDYAYLAICPDCPYPLNCPADKVRNGATERDIKADFEWPVPLWTDDRWPVEVLDFYADPESAWPLPPLAPGLGELKAINCIVSWLVNRTWQNGRQMWGVLGQYYDEMKKQLDDGDDLSVFAIPVGQHDDIKKICQLFESKEVNRDSWEILNLLSETFDKRVGLTAFVYGQNEDGTQDRTAETTNSRKQAVGVRPEFMQKKVIGWQSRAASVEGFLTRWFVKSNDVVPLLGQSGAMLWKQLIEGTDVELVVRQMDFQIAAASIRRPNKDRDIENMQEVMARWLPVAQGRGELTQDYQPINGAMQIWGELHDMDVSKLYFPASEQDPEMPQLQKEQLRAEVQKTSAEAQKAMAEAQSNPAELKAAELQMEAQNQEREGQLEIEVEQAKLKMELVRLQAEMEMKKAELEIKIQEGQLKLQQQQQQNELKAQQGQVDLEVKQATGMQQIQMGRQQMAMQKEQGKVAVQTAKEQSKTKVQTTKEQSAAKVSAAKQMAAAKPKPKAA